MANPNPILIPGPINAGTGYQLSQNETWRAEAVTATFNGAAAGAEFWPCCSVYTQAGTLLARFIPPSSVAAGDSAEVTYGPF